MADRREESIAPPRPLTGPDTTASKPILPPPPAASTSSPTPSVSTPSPGHEDTAAIPAGRVVRKAKLRLVQIEPWSVMKTSFLLSVAVGIVIVVAVAVVWGVLGAAGLWDSINSIVRDSIGDNNATSPFDIQRYLGTSRVLGFTMIVAVVDVVLITAIATLGAFLYNLAASLLGGVEVTFAEDR
jgi:hypothetical protein